MRPSKKKWDRRKGFGMQETGAPFRIIVMQGGTAKECSVKRKK